MPTEEFYAGQSNYIRKLNDLWDRATTSVFGTSTDSLSVTTGSKSFTTNTNLQFAAGSQVTITATADLSKYMSGQVTAYDQDTGAIVVNVTSVVGSGTFSSWSITLSGEMGATGAAGIADNLSIGTVTSGAAAASITGTSPNKFLNLTLQTGATGAAGAPNVLSIGTVTGGATASATITGASPAQVLNLVLPKGDTGDTGATGATGLTARGAWNASTAYVTSPSVDWVTYAGSSYYRKVAGTTPTDPATDTTNWGVLALKGADGAGTVAGVTASAPLASSGGATPNITITQANGSTNGFLSSSDWNTFNGKQAALGYTPANKAGDTFSGNVNIGTGTSAVTSLNVGKNITGGTTAQSFSTSAAIQSDVTTAAYGVNSQIATAAATFTLPLLAQFRASQPAFGAGSTVTTQVGYLATSLLAGATNNYAFQGQVLEGATNYNLYMSGSAKNYLAGSLGIGTTSISNFNLRVNKPITGGVTSYGSYSQGDTQSDVTGTAIYQGSTISTAASAFTLGQAVGFYVEQGTIGAGSAITNQMGYFVNSSLTGATNNFGFYGAIAAATGRWNLYMAGTAINYLAGNLLIGSSSNTGEKLQVTGNAKVTGTFSVGGSAIALGGNFTTSGAFATTFAMTANTSVTFPMSGTLLSTAAAVTVAQGGTGLSTLTSGSVLVGAGTASPTLVAPSTSGNVLTSNGTSWVSSAPVVGGSDLVLLTGSTFSGATSVDFTSVFSSTYDTYLINLENITGDTSGTNYVEMYLYSSGSFQTTQYSGSYSTNATSQTTYTQALMNSTELRLGGTVNVTSTSSSAQIMMYTPSNAYSKTLTCHGMSTSGYMFRAYGRWGGTNTVQGFRIKLTNGTISGSIQIYGYKKAV